MKDGPLIPRFGRARRDPALAVLEGFHPVKHALRFGASLELLVTSDPDELRQLADALAPDLGPRLAEARVLERAVFEQLSPLAPSTSVMAIAARPLVTAAELLASPHPAPGDPARGPPRPRQHGRLRAGGRRRRRGRGADHGHATTRGIRTRCGAPPACTSRCR